MLTYAETTPLMSLAVPASQPTMRAVPHLLLADDDVFNLQLLKRILQRDYRVTAVPSGELALRALQEDTFDLAILDVMMGMLNGYDVLEAIRQLPGGADMPVIMLSALAESQDVVRGLQLGANDYITKPFDIEELKLRVQNTINSTQRQNYMHPKSGLPTGRLIEEHLRGLMHSDKEWTYIDVKINHFDAFTEVYGFLAGDEVMRFTALVMGEVVDELGTPDDYLGHPERENFVVITHAADADKLKQRLVERFNDEVKQHYSFIDRERGYILVPDGTHGERQEPLMALAVGSVSTRTHQFSDIREVTELAAEDRRRGLSGEEDAGPRILTSW